MKSPDRFISIQSALFVLIFFYTIPVFGQTYDPITGELVPAATDTLKKSVEKPVFDPETGELLAPISGYRPGMISPATSKQGLGVNMGMNPCLQARFDAKKDASPLWYAGGIVYFIGPPAFFLSQPKPNPAKMLYQDPLENQLYSECYTLASYKERLKRMSLGCVGYIVFAILLF